MPLKIEAVIPNEPIAIVDPLANEDEHQYVRRFNGRKGTVLPLAGDYSASYITNDSGVTGAMVSDSLDWLAANTQAVDAGLSSIASLTTAADQIIYTTALDSYAVTSLTSYSRTLIGSVDAPAARATLDATGGRAGLTLNTFPKVGANGDLVNSGVTDDGSGNVTFSGNVTISGTSTFIDSTVVAVGDSLFKFAKDNTASDVLDIGWYGVYGPTPKYAGIFRDASDGVFKLFKETTEEPSTTVNTAGAGYALADLHVGTLTATSVTGADLVTGASNLTTQYRMAYVNAAGVLTESSSIVTDTGGRLGIGNGGTFIGSEKLHVVGDAYVNGGFRADNFRDDEVTAHNLLIGHGAAGGDYSVTVGEDAGSATASYFTASGYLSSEYSTGVGFTAKGYASARYATGAYFAANGFLSAQYSTGFHFTANGYAAARYAAGADSVAIGHNAYSTFIPDAANAKTVTAVDNATNQVTITGHGFINGVVAEASTTGTLPTGLASTPVVWTVVDANTLKCLSDSFTDNGTGTLTLTPAKSIDNSILIGYNVQPTKSNQVILGNDSITETLLKGNVLIGTTAPGAQSSRLHVSHDGACVSQLNLTAVNGGYLTLSDTDTTKLILGFGSNSGGTTNNDVVLRSQSGSLNFQTNGANDRMSIDSSGNVGIGITPVRDLHLHRDTLPDFHMTNTATGAGASDGFTITVDTLDVLINNRESGSLRFYTSGAEKARIDSSGNVGIGGAPLSSRKLELFSTTNNAVIQQRQTATQADINSYVVGGIDLSDLTRDGVSANPAGYFRFENVNTNPSFPTDIRGIDLVFGTSDGADGQGTAATERMRIDSSGSVLINGAATSAFEKMAIYQRNAGNAALSSGWIALSIGDGLADKVVLGQGSAGSVNRALIGGHNAALDAWADLTIGSSNLIITTDGANEVARFNTGGMLIGTTTLKTTEKLRVAGESVLGNNIISTGSLELNLYGTGDRTTFIDFHSDDTYTDFGLRIIKEVGATGRSLFQHRGTGELSIRALEAAAFTIHTSNTERMKIAADGGITMNNLPTSDPVVAGELWNNSGVVNISAG